MPTTPHRRGLYAPELLEARIAPATFVVKNLSDAMIDSLRNLIGVANANSGPDTITFDPALFAGNTPGKIPLSLDINIMDTLTIKGPGIDLLSISGSDLIRIFNIYDGSATTLSPTSISGLTLTDGKAAGSGGAICSAEPLTLNNVVVRSSTASTDGGGVFVKTTGKISIVNSRIVHNQANNDSGGLYLRGDAGITIVKSTIADNTGLTRGGLDARADGAKAVVLIDTCVISNNTATSGYGGGLVLFGEVGGKIILKNSLVTGNVANDGGGIFFNVGTTTIATTIVKGNAALVNQNLGSA